MIEEWRPVKGYEGFYEVSNMGNVRSLDKIDKNGRSLKGKILKQCIVQGYHVVGLSLDGSLKQVKVHRLVAESFIPNNDGLPQVNHKNEDKHDNRACNLEWCTTLYNLNYGTRNERISKKQRNRTDQRKPIQQIKDGVVIATYPSRNESARQTGFLKNAIGNAVTGRTKTAYGYEWKYL